MTVSIIKSSTTVAQRVPLGRIGGLADRISIDGRHSGGEEPSQESPEFQKLIEQLRQEFENEFQAKLESHRELAAEQGYKDGFESGHRDGLESAAESFKRQSQQLDRVMQEIESAWADQLEDAHHVAVEIAFDAVCRVIGERAADADVVAGMVAQIIANLREVDILTIRLHPVECGSLRAALRKGSLDALSARLIDKLTEDPTLEMGGCIVETPRGDYRAPLDVQLHRLRDMLDAQRDQLGLLTSTVRDVRRA